MRRAEEGAQAAAKPRPARTVRLADLLGKVAGRALHKRGRALAVLIQEWPRLGGALGTHSRPERLVFPRGRTDGATLHLRVAGALATELLHRQPMLLERIALLLGPGVVTALKLVQGAIPGPPGRAPAAPLGAAALARLEAQCAAITDPQLRESLARLGVALLSPRARRGPALPGPGRPHPDRFVRRS